MRYNLKTKKYFALIFLFFTLLFVRFIYLRYQLPVSDNNYASNNELIFIWKHSPQKISINKPLKLMFTLKNKNSVTIPNAHFDLEATMNHGGMKPIITRAFFSPSLQIYETQINLNMQGEWIIFLTITLENKQIIKKTLSFTTD